LCVKLTDTDGVNSWTLTFVKYPNPYSINNGTIRGLSDADLDTLLDLIMDLKCKT
jgi:hypothetical protein